MLNWSVHSQLTVFYWELVLMLYCNSPSYFNQSMPKTALASFSRCISIANGRQYARYLTITSTHPRIAWLSSLIISRKQVFDQRTCLSRSSFSLTIVWRESKNQDMIRQWLLQAELLFSFGWPFCDRDALRNYVAHWVRQPITSRTHWSRGHEREPSSRRVATLRGQKTALALLFMQLWTVTNRSWSL